MQEQFSAQQNNERKSELSNQMSNVLRDYCNHFMALKMWYERGGLPAVKELIQEFKIESFEEYLSKGKDSMLELSNDDRNNEEFKKHVAMLDAFALQINTHGQDITEETFKNGMDEVNSFLSR